MIKHIIEKFNYPPKITWEQVLADESLLDEYVMQKTAFVNDTTKFPQYPFSFNLYGSGLHYDNPRAFSDDIKKEYAEAKKLMMEKDLAPSEIPCQHQYLDNPRV